MNDEAERRKTVALEAIKKAFGREDQEYGVNLFVEHHLAMIAASYWKAQLGFTEPSPKQVLSLLQFRSCWGDDDQDGFEFFDFTLPEEITDYVLCVRFGDNGQIDEIFMES